MLQYITFPCLIAGECLQTRLKYYANQSYLNMALHTIKYLYICVILSCFIVLFRRDLIMCVLQSLHERSRDVSIYCDILVKLECLFKTFQEGKLKHLYFL